MSLMPVGQLDVRSWFDDDVEKIRKSLQLRGLVVATTDSFYGLSKQSLTWF